MTGQGEGGAVQTTTIKAWQLSTSHVLVVDGHQVSLAATDAGEDSEGHHQVIARPADGGRAHRFGTHDDVTVVVQGSAEGLGKEEQDALFDAFTESRFDVRDGSYNEYVPRAIEEAMPRLETVVAALVAQARADGAAKEREAILSELAEARHWAWHGYEIGQRSATWSDHGVAPKWLLDGPPGAERWPS